MHVQYTRLERIAALFSSLVSPLAHFDKYVKRYGDLLNDRGLLVLDMNDSMNMVSQSGCGGGACG